MLSLIKRNLLYTLRDRTSFAMSFISVAILIMMYKLFLNDLQISQLKAAIHSQHVGLAGTTMINFWLISGLVVVTLATAAINGLSVLVEDRVSGKQADFMIAGVKPYRMLLAYLISAVILTFITTGATFLVGTIIFVGWSGLTGFSLVAWSQLVGLMVFASLLACLLALPWVAMMKSLQSFSIFSTMVGTLIGFVAGIYLPLGALSNSLQKLVLSLPFVHEGALFKQILMAPSADSFFKGMSAAARQQYDLFFGNRLTDLAGQVISSGASQLYLLAWLVVASLLTILSYYWSQRH